MARRWPGGLRNIFLYYPTVCQSENVEGSKTKVKKKLFLFSERQFWRIQFPSGLGTGKSISVNVDTVFTHVLAPYPREITQAEKQFVTFTGNLVLTVSSIWDAAWQNQQYGCAPRKDSDQTGRIRSAWASAHSDQSLRCPHEEVSGP